MRPEEEVVVKRLAGTIDGSDQCHLIAERPGDGRVVGYAKMHRWPGEGVIGLYDLLVDTEEWGKGVGREICRVAEEIATGPDLPLVAYTRPKNLASQGFFKAIGWIHYTTDEEGGGRRGPRAQEEEADES